MTVEIAIVPCLSDNYAYLVKRGNGLRRGGPFRTGAGDRGAGGASGWKLTHILNTHHHLDHTGGNLALKQAYGRDGGGAGQGHGAYSGNGRRGERGLRLGIRRAAVRVLEVPAHTRGAITFVIDGNAFTGDTLFAMGCGRLFEGDPQMMWNSLSKLMTPAGCDQNLLRP